MLLVSIITMLAFRHVNVLCSGSQLFLALLFFIFPHLIDSVWILIVHWYFDISVFLNERYGVVKLLVEHCHSQGCIAVDIN